jgi:RNA polymerase sigma-70 factor (ECF subfamily)
MNSPRTRVLPTEERCERASGVDAWTDEYVAHYSRMVLIAAAVSGQRMAAEDIVQEAALIAVKKKGLFRPGTSFSAWLADIVRKCALNHRRKVSRRGTIPFDPHALAEVPDTNSPRSDPKKDPAHETNSWQPWFDDQVWAALGQLSPDARCCLLLRTVHGLSYAEIAQTLNMPEGTAMSHVHRGRAAMRQALVNNKTVQPGLTPQSHL